MNLSLILSIAAALIGLFSSLHFVYIHDTDAAIWAGTAAIWALNVTIREWS